jgi:NifU-like protein
VSIYPPSVNKRIGNLENVGEVLDANAIGKDVAFTCGVFVGFSLKIDDLSRVVTEARFRSNGCGYMLAAADVLCEMVKGRPLADLNGLDNDQLREEVERQTGVPDEGRVHCIDTCISALHLAFADHRTRLIEEFRGEKALICTCFGISEETIEHLITNGAPKTVDDVANACNAGSGCGSCRMLIQEMLDSALYESNSTP